MSEFDENRAYERGYANGARDGVSDITNEAIKIQCEDAAEIKALKARVVELESRLTSFTSDESVERACAAWKAEKGEWPGTIWMLAALKAVAGETV